MAHGAPDHRLVIDLVELVKLITRIEKIDEVTRLKLIDSITSVDQVKLITSIGTIDSVVEVGLSKIVPLVSPPLLLLDQFDSGILKWGPSGYGRLELSNKYAFSGSGSLLIYTGPGTGKAHYALRYIAVSAGLTMRLMQRFSFDDYYVLEYRTSLSRYNGSDEIKGQVRYLPADDKWQYWLGDDNWADIPGGTQKLTSIFNVWHHLTLECDFSMKKYVQLKVDSLTIDMSALDLITTTEPAGEYTIVSIGGVAIADRIAEIFVDDVYVEAW